jgi:succinoglycan biosynthesis protein ExoM
VQRRFRAGQTHGTHLSQGVVANVKAAAIASGKAAFCGVMTILTLFSPSRWRKNLLRGALHVGVIGGIFGAKQAVLYGQPTEGSQSHA